MGNVLVVGAGAVGQVFAWHAAKGGAAVSFLVKEKHAAECRAGFNLYALNRDRRRERPLKLRPASVLTSAEQAAGTSWDAVFLCFSSPALRTARIAELARATGDAPIVCLTPGLEDRDYVLSQGVAEERIVAGMLSLLSYWTPLPGEQVAEPGTAYWFPPASPLPFSGPRARGVVEHLSAGGMPAALHRDVVRELAFMGVGTGCLIPALEAAGWSLKGLRSGEYLGVGARASQEALSIVANKLGGKAPLGLRLALRCGVLGPALALAPKFVPVPLESYLRAHFTKVRDQTIQGLDEYIAAGKKARLATTNLQKLLDALNGSAGT